MKEKLKEITRLLKILSYLVLLVLTIYSIMITNNYWEATLYLVMIGISLLMEVLTLIKTSLDRIFYQLYLMNNKETREDDSNE